MFSPIHPTVQTMAYATRVFCLFKSVVVFVWVFFFFFFFLFVFFLCVCVPPPPPVRKQKLVGRRFLMDHGLSISVISEFMTLPLIIAPEGI